MMMMMMTMIMIIIIIITRKRGYNMYREWTQTDYQNKHYNINRKDDDRGRDGGTNCILRIKEEETRLTFQEHDDDDDEFGSLKSRKKFLKLYMLCTLL